MGRWTYSDRLTTEKCKSIPVKFLNEYGYFDGRVRWGGLSWSRGSVFIGNLAFVVSTGKGNEYIRLQYTHTNNNSGEKTEMDYKVQLASTPCYFGGRRWWFICPWEVNGRACNRRVGVLYLGGGMYFGCRHCYNLTYKSRKEHDKRLDFLRKDPTLFLSYLRSDDPEKMLMAFKVAETKYL